MISILEKSKSQIVQFRYIETDEEVEALNAEEGSIVLIGLNAPTTSATVDFAVDLRDEHISKNDLIKLLKSSNDIDFTFDFNGEGDFCLINGMPV